VDGPGRRLGRTFRVKLWPTLVLLRDGQEIGRIVRPTSSGEISDLLAA
jgi:thioredoxin 1